MAAPTQHLFGLRVTTHALAIDDKWVLMHKGKVVAVVDAGAPIEDAVCDEVIVPQADFDRIAARIPTAK